MLSEVPYPGEAGTEAAGTLSPTYWRGTRKDPDLAEQEETAGKLEGTRRDVQRTGKLGHGGSRNQYLVSVVTGVQTAEGVSGIRF